MADEPAQPAAKDAAAKVEDTTIAAAADVLTTEVVGSAESYRKLGEVFVSALAAIPTATLVTTLIRAPDAGLHEWKLAFGLAFAALALILGVMLAVWLRTPVEISRAQLEKVDMARIVGTSQRDYNELLTRIAELQDWLATASDKERPTVERHFNGAIATLRNVQLLATADALRMRVLGSKTKRLAGAALIAAAVAVFFLAVAPKPKPADDKAAAAGPTVVKVTLTDEGAKKLGCPKTVFSALKFGGTDTAPQVVPIGGVKCTVGDYLTLKVPEKKDLAIEVKALESVGPPTTSPSP